VREVAIFKKKKVYEKVRGLDINGKSPYEKGHPVRKIAFIFKKIDYKYIKLYGQQKYIIIIA